MSRTNLIRRCQFGDKQAFEELYQLYCQQALKTAYLICGHREIIEDIVQEAFIQCFKEIKQLREPEAFYSWFYKILIRCCWRVSRKYQNKIPITSFSENYEPIDRNFSMDDLIEAKEACDIVQQALLKLKAPMRLVITLFYYNNMTISEIASVLGCFQGTVKSRLYNAKRILEKELKLYFFHEDFLEDKTQRKESVANG